MMRGDLHIHSRQSDGSYTYREAIQQAKKAGLSFISFTDHDTIAGADEAVALGMEMGMTVIPGVEISVWDRIGQRKVHVLGYGYRTDGNAISELCKPVLAARHCNTLRQLEILQAAGYPIDLEKVCLVAAGSQVLYKQHLMKVLVNAGLDDELYGSLYRKLFKDGGIASGDIDYPDVFDAIRAISADGGIAVLAHPGQLDNWDLVPALVEAGLQGIEYLHESHRTEDHRRAIVLAQHYGLLLTGGSDDHGELGSNIHIGDSCASADLLYALLERDHPAMGIVLPLVLEAASRLQAAAAEVVETHHKSGNHQDLVTRWDHEIETFIISGLSAAFPASQFIAEEQSDGEGWEGQSLPTVWTWILDPIDGTTNFADTGREYAISLALYTKGRAELALVFDCERDRLYSAAAGRGARINGRPLHTQVRPSFDTSRPLRGETIDISLNSMMILSPSSADLARLNAEIRGHRASGCASLNICRVAEGTLGAYVSAKLGFWDWAAAQLILSETGGTTWEGPVFGPDLGLRSKRFFLAARTQTVGEALLAALCTTEYRSKITAKF